MVVLLPTRARQRHVEHNKKFCVLLSVFSLESQVLQKDVVRAVVWDFLEGPCHQYGVCLHRSMCSVV